MLHKYKEGDVVRVVVEGSVPFTLRITALVTPVVVGDLLYRGICGCHNSPVTVAEGDIAGLVEEEASITFTDNLQKVREILEG